AVVDADPRAGEGRVRPGRLNACVSRAGDDDGAVQGAGDLRAARDGERRRAVDKERRDDHRPRRRIGPSMIMRRVLAILAVGAVSALVHRSAPVSAREGGTPIVDNERVTVWDVTAADPNAPRPQGDSVWISLINLGKAIVKPKGAIVDVSSLGGRSIVIDLKDA